ncbi:MAG: sigma-70 family RNA polymerase sigma factor [Arenimonas sp.]
MKDDRALVQAVLERAPGAFERLVVQHQNLVWHMVYRMVQQRDDAEELSQEVFLRVHQKLHQFRYDSALSTWIGSIAFSIATRHLQRKRISLVDETDGEEGSLLERIGDDFDLEKAHVDREFQTHIAEAMNKLSPIQRTLVSLYHLDEMSLLDIARVTELPEGTVKNYLFRARLKLRQALESKMGELA